MTFAQVRKTVKFPRNEHVDVHVRLIDLNATAPEDARLPAIEIREFIKAGEIYGHGLVIPAANAADLKTALDQVLR